MSERRVTCKKLRELSADKKYALNKSISKLFEPNAEGKYNLDKLKTGRKQLNFLRSCRIRGPKVDTQKIKSHIKSKLKLPKKCRPDYTSYGAVVSDLSDKFDNILTTREIESALNKKSFAKKSIWDEWQDACKGAGMLIGGCCCKCGNPCGGSMQDFVSIKKREKELKDIKEVRGLSDSEKRELDSLKETWELLKTQDPEGYSDWKKSLDLAAAKSTDTEEKIIEVAAQDFKEIMNSSLPEEQKAEQIADVVQEMKIQKIENLEQLKNDMIEQVAEKVAEQVEEKAEQKAEEKIPEPVFAAVADMMNRVNEKINKIENNDDPDELADIIQEAMTKKKPRGKMPIGNLDELKTMLNPCEYKSSTAWLKALREKGQNFNITKTRKLLNERGKKSSMFLDYADRCDLAIPRKLGPKKRAESKAKKPREKKPTKKQLKEEKLKKQAAELFEYEF